MKRLVIVLGVSLCCAAALANELIVPAAARGAGANGTFFKTDLRIVNLSGVAAGVELTFLPSGVDNSGATAMTVSVGSRQSIESDDALMSLFSLENGMGAIRIRSAASLAASSRTYTASSNGSCPGSFGQHIPALTPDMVLGRAVIADIRTSAVTTSGFRTNLGFMNPASISASLTARLRSGNGSLLGTASVAIPPLGHVQQVLQTLFDVGTLTSTDSFVEIDATSSPVIAYASVVDNLSGDSFFILAEEDSGTPLEGMTVLAKQWRFEPSTIEARVGELMTLQVRAIDVDHGISFSGVGPFTCSNEQAGQCILRPNETVTVSFTPRDEGSFAFFCTRFCDESLDGSAGHSTMRGTLVVRP